MINPLKQTPIGPLQKIKRLNKKSEHRPRRKFIQHPIPEGGRECSLDYSNVIPLQPRQISFIEDLLGDG